MKAFLRSLSCFNVILWFAWLIQDACQSRSTNWLIADLATIVFWLVVLVFTLPTRSPNP